MIILDMTNDKIVSLDKDKLDPIGAAIVDFVQKETAGDIAGICSEVGPFFIVDVTAKCASIYSEQLSRLSPQVREVMRRYSEELVKTNERYNKLLVEAGKTCTHRKEPEIRLPDILNLRPHG